MCLCAAILIAPALAVAADCSPHGPLRSGHVRHVIDGDTVILDSGRHIRIVGLNAPEIGHRGEPDEPYAQAARKRLVKLLAATHNQLEWSFAPERHDHYGRTLAHLYINGKDASRVLLEAGLAALIAIPPNVGRERCHAVAERMARWRKIGLWSPSSGVVRAAADADRPGFEIVRGRVARVSRKHAGTLVALEGGLDLWIPADDRRYFDKSLENLAGRRILVRGWQHDYHGRAEIIVHHPAVLTRLPAPDR